MVTLFCGYEKLLWKSKSHVCNLKHQSLHHLQYSCFYGQIQWQPYKHFLLNLFPYILKSWVKEVYCFRIELYSSIISEVQETFQVFLFLYEEIFTHAKKHKMQTNDFHLDIFICLKSIKKAYKQLSFIKSIKYQTSFVLDTFKKY